MKHEMSSGPQEPRKDEIEKHNLLHHPQMPWCDMCIRMHATDPEDPAGDPIGLRVCRIAVRTTRGLHVLEQWPKAKRIHTSLPQFSLLASGNPI